MNNLSYLIVKKKDSKEIIYFQVDKQKGYDIKPKNKNIKLKDAINVSSITVFNTSLIENIINKKVNIKIRKLIDFLVNNSENDEDPASDLMLCLNEIEKFKREIFNKYINFMNQKQIKLLEQKIKLLEEQITMHIYMINDKETIVYETRKRR